MKLKGKLIMSLLGAAMLALPMTTPAFAEPSYGTNSNYIERVDWWWDHHGHDVNEYAYRGWHPGQYEYRGHKYACERARGLEAQVWQDRRKGHPAAANDVAEEAAAARARCYNRY